MSTRSYRDRVLVQQAIEDRVAGGMSREDAMREVLDQEAAWRAEEAEAARWTIWEEYAEIAMIAGNLCRRARARLTGKPARQRGGKHRAR